MTGCVFSLPSQSLWEAKQQPAPADTQKPNTCMLPSWESSLPETDIYSKKKMSCGTVPQQSAGDDCFVFLNEDSLCCGWGGGELTLSLSPGNIWNRSASWPGLVLPRLTATHTWSQLQAFNSLHPLLSLLLLVYLPCLPLSPSSMTPFCLLPILHRRAL